ncbi:MAG: insulinase family protein, partial [Kiritimatiellae bacterium]|nr:insulinase family protein [Kiritimatiellia bacterium]
MRQERFLLTLARHLKQPEFGNGQHVRPCAVALERGLQRFLHLLLVLAALHVDEIENHKTADVAQTQLVLGLRVGKAMTAPNYAAIEVFNALFGGGVGSKLFLNVRERLSL